MSGRRKIPANIIAEAHSRADDLHTITIMPIQFLSSFLPTADDVLQAELPRLSRILLIVLNSWKDAGKVYQANGGINRGYCIAMMEGRIIGLGPPPQNGPEYGNRQPEVTAAVLEAYGWLENNNFLMRTPGQPAPDWFHDTRRK